MIGLFINTIPVRVSYENESTPVTFLKKLQEKAIQSTPHHYMNLSEVQAQSDLGMNLIDHILVFENFAEKELENEGVLNTREAEGLSVESMEVFERTNYDLNVVITPGAGALDISIIYNLDCYDRSAVNNAIGHLEKLVDYFVETPNQPLSAVDYLSVAEKSQVIDTFNDTRVDYPADQNLVSLFEKQVEKTPDNIAVTYEGVNLSYRELNERSNQLANYLRQNYNIQPNDLVGIMQERSDWMIVSIYGILKAGGACVPIDTQYPPERVDFIEQDTESKVCLDRDELDHFMKVRTDYDKENPLVPLEGENRAYIIYTSGSSGQPKGVILSHENLVVKLFEEREILEVNDDMVTYCITNYVFDSTFLEIILPLMVGGRVHMPEHYSVKDGVYTVQQIIEQGANVLQATPTYFAYLLSDTTPEMIGKLNQNLRIICLGGESLNAKLAGKINKLLPDVRLNNQYGPTEITIDGIVNEDIKSYPSNIIGKPLGNTRAYIVDNELRPVPVFVAGEILLAGPSVAPGYLNRADLTKEKFTPNPFEKGEYLYRTGDMGKWLPDGTIEFLGRKDDQIKIRGHRIELGEIEQTILKFNGMEEVVVLVIEPNDENNEKELAAYFTAKEEDQSNEIRKYLKERLPRYMVPSYFIQLEAMPLTTNNKLNKKALPAPEGLSMVGGVEYVAPRNEIEEKIVSIWSEVLQKEKIGVQDDFFDLGGHSLKIVQVITKIQKEYDVKLEMSKIFELTTVEQLAEFISIVAWDYSDAENELENFKI